MSDKVDVEVGVTLNIECVEELVLTFREILKQNGATNFLMSGLTIGREQRILGNHSSCWWQNAN